MASSKRCYKQFCGVARALDVLGERWTLLIARDLLLGSWRYTDLMARLPGITTNLLAERLREMEANGWLFPVIRMDCRFLSPLRYGDVALVDVAVQEGLLARHHRIGER